MCRVLNECTTYISLKDYFDRNPVSRFQAKLICSKLECYKEVELDFDGLEWIGQGFAHQLFVVFTKNHPDIKLTPFNLSDEVLKMYNHVVSNK